MKIKHRLTIAVVATCWLTLSSSMALAASPESGQPPRARLIVLTDIGNEPDDAESLVRLLLYANDIEIEGLVAATSRHLPTDPKPAMIKERVDAYGEVLANLRRHDPRYPDAETLRQRIRTGSPVYGMSGVGNSKQTAASRLIIEAVDSPDPRPVWVAVWGGAADLAQALWTVRETRSAEELARFVAKLRVYSISDQDDAGPWARAYFPDLFWVADVHAFTRYRLGTWGGISAPLPGADASVVSEHWLRSNIHGQGPLGKLYPLPAYLMEGDTPSYLSLIPNGLSLAERPDWGGWGGRYEKVSKTLGLWTTTLDEVRGIDGNVHTSAPATLWRWRPAFQNDFAARVQWSLTSDYASANHAPEIVLNGQDGLAPVEIAGCSGESITLSADGSGDPDGDALSYRWRVYREATGLFAPAVELASTTGPETAVVIGDTARTDQFTPPSTYRLHVILEATDNGTPHLTRYRRAIISVPGLGFDTAPDGCGVTPVGPGH